MPGLESAQGTADGLAAPLVVQGRGVGHTGLTQQISQGIVHSAEASHCLKHHVLALLHPDHLLHLLPGLQRSNVRKLSLRTQVSTPQSIRCSAFVKHT